ncbi:MAG: hypothetical protein M3O70_21915 [Actinomycetota bacterium]|nr:hypothetical protein [Actinomycetota bacterium]
MTQDTGGYPPSTGAALPPDAPAADVARHEAAGVGQTAGEAGGQVAQAATQQAREVASETAQQARSMLDEGMGQLRQQAREGQQKVASGLRTLADELRGMAKKGGQSGIAGDLVREASDRAHGAAAWLERRGPGDLLEEVRGFARQRPGTFLLGAALAGVVAGRLTRGAVGSGTSTEDAGERGQQQLPRQTPAPTAPQAAPVAGTAPVENLVVPSAAGYPHQPYPVPGSAPDVQPAPAPRATSWDSAERPEDYGREAPAEWNPATDPPLTDELLGEREGDETGYLHGRVQP